MLSINPADLTEVLRTLLDQGFEPPLYFAGIATNGSMVMGMYEQAGGLERLKGTILANRVCDGTFTAPINFMCTDRQGEAAGVVFAALGKPVVYH